MSLRGLLAWVLVLLAAGGALLAVNQLLIDPLAQRMAATDFSAVNQWRVTAALALLAVFVATGLAWAWWWQKKQAPAESQQERTN